MRKTATCKTLNLLIEAQQQQGKFDLKMENAMTTSPNEIDALKEEIKKLQRKRNIAETDHRKISDKKIQTLSEEIIATRKTLNLLIEAQQQGKFLLSFSFLFFSSIIFVCQPHTFIRLLLFDASFWIGLDVLRQQ